MKYQNFFFLQCEMFMKYQMTLCTSSLKYFKCYFAYFVRNNDRLFCHDAACNICMYNIPIICKTAVWNYMQVHTYVYTHYVGVCMQPTQLISFARIFYKIIIQKCIFSFSSCINILTAHSMILNISTLIVNFSGFHRACIYG